MSKIVVYEHVDFKGLSREFTSSVPNLVDLGFNNCVSSLKVFGNPWVAYSAINFSGSQFVFEEGDYARVQSNDAFSSLELLSEDLSDPQITLYQHRRYKGRSVVFTSENNLTYGSFNDRASSHKVQRGVWVLYQHPDRGGAQMVARASRPNPSYGWFNDRVSHVRPLRPGKPTVETEVLWDKKEEQVRSVEVDSIDGWNYGDHDQSFSAEMFKEYESSVTDSFSFSNATAISFGTSFKVNVGVITAGLNSSLSNTFTVKRGDTNTRTERESIRVTLPTRVPPHTKLTVRILKKEVDAKVPVKMTITSGSRRTVEYGEYRCQSGNSISTEFREEQI